MRSNNDVFITATRRPQHYLIAIKHAQNQLTRRERTQLLKKFDSCIDDVGGDDKAEFFRCDSAAIIKLGLERGPLCTYGHGGHLFWIWSSIHVNGTTEAGQE